MSRRRGDDAGIRRRLGISVVCGGKHIATLVWCQRASHWPGVHTVGDRGTKPRQVQTHLADAVERGPRVEVGAGPTLVQSTRTVGKSRHEIAVELGLQLHRLSVQHTVDFLLVAVIDLFVHGFSFNNFPTDEESLAGPLLVQAGGPVGRFHASI